ncbi:metallophosphoesterase family protein [Ferruginibacter yonginensis]|uniref:Metallophosphoesterase family protein n=1 Tax=Ferruginibacter yonginensis TaxID=1310416 RepID=A0ABV8QVM0_9BACT
MAKTFVIGDIHGGLKALQQVLQLAPINTHDTLIFLGDYVDGWSEAAPVVDFVMQLATQQPCIFIKGNHDWWCEQWLATGIANETWVQHGGAETMQSYKDYTFETMQAHLQFFKSLPYFYIDEANRLFIHAGFTEGQNVTTDFTTAPEKWDRTLWYEAIKLNGIGPQTKPVLSTRMQLYSEIFMGHTPTTYNDCTTPMQVGNIINVDTGAAFKGKLSIMDVATKAYWQSDALPLLYPNEVGRNKND